MVFGSVEPWLVEDVAIDMQAIKSNHQAIKQSNTWHVGPVDHPRIYPITPLKFNGGIPRLPYFPERKIGFAANNHFQDSQICQIFRVFSRDIPPVHLICTACLSLGADWSHWFHLSSQEVAFRQTRWEWWCWSCWRSTKNPWGKKGRRT